ncbi:MULTISPECIES: glutathione peroxidase [unclassified Ruegeria]|uniref:glutathione peroxidase n=1 Tax=unclassified Ruegeria TaxID=2625375 RepID=UPI0014920BE4|nr:MULTISPECIES: glutathione peroxidase [unclassified Ruegeria]NOD84572.1 glutathione peroxidase [Ruegeria sp. HKCCD6119]
MMRLLLLTALILLGRAVQAAPLTGEFDSIDGGTLAIEEWRGQPILVVNTASQCGFTGQYKALQRVHEDYSGKGLVVLAVPSDSFNQELGSAEEVKQFCEMNYGLTLPMTDITPVKGADAHPFYKAVAAQTGFTPKWNFNKILINSEGEVAATFGSNVKPDSRKLLSQVEALLP